MERHFKWQGYSVYKKHASEKVMPPLLPDIWYNKMSSF
ncbi:hypothetical protein X965_05760 [Morganella sp. EGD-HP17]|nr:hypothetical protein X965_05760 [Morganella sp. EGD-HP17]